MPDHSSSVPRQPFSPPRRLLVRGVNWLGDAVMTTPALQRLREHFPQAHISLLTHEKIAELWLGHASLDAVLTFAPGESPWSVARRLRAGHFDSALVLPNSPRSALEVWLAGIPQRIGNARPWRNWFLSQRVSPPAVAVTMRKLSAREVKHRIRSLDHRASIANQTAPGPRPCSHQIHAYLHLAAALGASLEPAPPMLEVKPEEVRAAAAKFGLEADTLAGRPVLGLNPGAEYGPAKRRPADRFVAAARELQKRTHCVCLIFGGPSDVPTAGALASGLGGRAPGAQTALFNVAGKTSLRELMALLKLCRVLLTNDSGPMHVAAALNTPVVVPFGSTSPELTGPGLPGDPRHQLLECEVPCSPCFRRTCPIDFRCMTGISVERVVAAVGRSL